jgi:membrane protein required for colicin V production
MLTAFDVGVGILVLISAILATARGLTREILSLATWAGSAAIAIYMWQYHPEIAREYIAEQVVADVATVVVSFIVSLIVLHLITMRIADFVVDSRIGPLDRTLGFVFGVLRGLLIAIVVVIFGLWLLPNNLPPWAANSQSLPHLRNMGDALISILPDNLEEQVTRVLRGGTGITEDDADPQGPLDQGTDSTEDGSPLPAPQNLEPTPGADVGA